MKHKKLKLCALLLLGLGLQELQEQIITLATEDNASGSGGSTNYSVRQVAYNTFNVSSSGTVAQSVQQPFNNSVLTELKHSQDQTLTVRHIQI